MAGLKRITTATSFNQANYNYNVDSHENVGVYAHGRGVISGLALSDAGGLTVGISAGMLMARAAYEFDAFEFDVTDDAVSFLWIDEDGAITESATSADPGGYVVCLGRVTAVAGNITTVETYGRMSIWRQSSIRVHQLGESLVYADLLNNRVGIGKTPSTDLDVTGTATFVNVTSTGDLVVAGKVKTSSRVEFVEVGSDPTAVANSCLLYSKDVGGVTELFWRDSAGNVRQLTNAGVLALGGLDTDDVPEGAANFYFTNERVDDRVNALLVEGSGIDVSYNDGANTLTLTKVQGTVHEADPENDEDLAGTKTLTNADRNVQALNPNGANRDVQLPASPLGWGDWFRIMNVGTANNLVVKSNGGGSTLVTLTPGQFCWIRPVTSSGSPAWPSSATAESMGGAL